MSKVVVTPENRLSETEIPYHLLTDAAPALFWLVDQTGTNLIYANQTLLQFFGVPFQTISDQGWLDFVLPEDRKQTREGLIEAVKTATCFEQEVRILNRDGTYRWVLAQAKPWRGNDGQLLGLIGTSLDITERKETEAALEESEIRFRTMADASPVLIWMNDHESGNLIYANKALLEFYGVTFDAIAHLGWEPFLHPDDLESLKSSLGNAFKNQCEFELEFRMKRADGQYRWIWSKGAPRFQNHKHFLGLVGTSVDITDIKEAREELELKVHERTQQLEALNKELEAFAYSVSHDLRAPLRSIDGFSKMLLSKTKAKLNDDEQRYLNNICENSQRMGELIDDLLKLSRLSRADMTVEQVDLGSMARQIIADLQEQDPDRQASIDIEDGLVAEGDASLLHVLLENLLNNAWKYTSKLEKTAIQFGKYIDNEGETIYFIRDNGAGFNMKYVDKLFGAFQRLHRMDEFPGTGVGLATVQRIINRHGGKIWAESAVNQGATFYFTV